MPADVHTLLRLPTGIFYAQGVKANVLFFDRKPAADKQAWTTKLWIYDLRTNLHFTLKENPLKRADLDDFVACYNPKNRYKRKPTLSEENGKGRFCSYAYEELLRRDKVHLDIFWLKDESFEKSLDLPSLRRVEVVQQKMRSRNLIRTHLGERQEVGVGEHRRLEGCLLRSLSND